MGKAATPEVPFYRYLWTYYDQNRGRIRRHYRDLTKKFLDYNEPDGSRAWHLRKPQYEALEMYVFLKEYLENAPVHRVFEDWYKRQGRFENREMGIAGAEEGQGSFFTPFDAKTYEAVFRQMKGARQPYANYVFALTMGTGKTLLMATCIFYDFLLANKFPKEPKYLHNALVFAPDTTVLESLREIDTFDRSLVVPPEYVNVLNSLLRIHVLDDAGMTLNTHDGSRFNLIISNTQKIILKRQGADKTAAETLFSSGRSVYERGEGFSALAELYNFDELENEKDLSTNQRFEKLRRLEQLGVFVDEAHHAFGNQLERDLGRRRTQTSLRVTIDELALELKRSGTQVVACYNFTGTPYAKGKLFPEVVYAYGLQEAIDAGYLKRARVHAYENVKNEGFIRSVLERFWEAHTEEKPDGRRVPVRHEGMLPKLAIFAPTVDELTQEVRPAVESVLAELGVPASSVLVNVGDTSVTSNDDLREFKLLDTPASKKQVILLVNKGKEGWNARSLFGVALYRKPRSRIFVLQATMRCLRAIGNPQQTGHIYLSEENKEILIEELEQNFRLDLDALQRAGTAEKQPYQVRVVPPRRTITITRVRKLYQLKERTPGPGITFGLDDLDPAQYEGRVTVKEGLGDNAPVAGTETVEVEQRAFSALTLSAEVARYLNRSPVGVERALRESAEGMEALVDWSSRYNQVLYEVIIPRLFAALYELREYEDKEDEAVELVKEPEGGHYVVHAQPEDVVTMSSVGGGLRSSSFHLDTYAFDSRPEQRFFRDLLGHPDVKQLYFTGMLTHGQTDFYVQYVDPESNAVRAYYPDFLVETRDGTWLIVEVKGDNKVDDPIVQAKEAYTRQMANASQMRYRLIRGSEVLQGLAASVLT